MLGLTLQQILIKRSAIKEYGGVGNFLAITTLLLTKRTLLPME